MSNILKETGRKHFTFLLIFGFMGFSWFLKYFNSLCYQPCLSTFSKSDTVLGIGHTAIDEIIPGCEEETVALGRIDT